MTALFITILNMSISASVVALAVMLVRIPLKKAPKIFSYVLWGVVLFRLICPFSIEGIFSIMPMSSNAIPQDIVYSQSPAIQTGLQFVDTPVNTAITNALPTTNPENTINPIHTVLHIAGYVWLFGFVALLLYATIGYIRLKRLVYYATLVHDNIYETDKIKTPFVLGFIRPKIYMPIGIDPSQHDYILKHEQTHIKRRDYIIKPFAFIVFALHWFNPLMWVAYFLMSKDIEMSCDESVLKKTDEDIRGVYSYSLLNLSVKRVSLLSPLAFGESNVQSRVKNVLTFKKPAKWLLVVSFLIVFVFLVGFTSNRVNALDILNTEQGQQIVNEFIDKGVNLLAVLNEPPLTTVYDDNAIMMIKRSCIDGTSDNDITALDGFITYYEKAVDEYKNANFEASYENLGRAIYYLIKLNIPDEIMGNIKADRILETNMPSLQYVFFRNNNLESIGKSYMSYARDNLSALLNGYGSTETTANNVSINSQRAISGVLYKFYLDTK